ncbi:ATP-binding protein [Roseateles depolymerans]|uniref:histidine kinase n=1 Tax=Roseateles depolymerans TaxID=76731 RepID=A0A0U3LH46_9BURK|nr:ATP-binding protein [Roseateles depolymerans]ALV07423.1 Signal transduction histidine kinase [Roseateles depolymerans]REG22363.1 two-component system OmpR family sensor kinase [Roseateles depolymerans]
MSVLPRSLRYRLLLFLLGAMLLSALVQGGSAYRNALAEADEIFDYQMQQVALSLRAGMGTGLPLPLGEEQSIDLIVQVWSLDGTPLYRSAGPDWLPQRAVLGFSNVELKGKRYRVLAIQGRFQVVQVAQDLSVRQRMAGQLAWRTVLPTAMMLPLLAMVVWWVVSYSLDPLQRVRQQISRRAAQDLSPVDAADLPSEVEPLVTELNALLERVRQAFETQQQFVADAAHELRSPLAALKLQLQALRRAPDDQARAQATERLATGIDRAGRLIEQLLTLARQDSAKVQAPPQVIALDALCRDGVVEASTLAQARGVDVGLGRCDAVEVSGQQDALRILLRNLLDNGVKYGRSRVDLSLERTAHQALVVVEDDGPGIPDAERSRVFDRFYRSEAQAQQAPGSGLGLAIARSIASDHGATLRLGHSTSLGGLRVELAFPLRSDAAQSALPRAALREL